MVLAFGLGLIAALVKSDLKLPDGLYQALSAYLLLAIGLKGGTALSSTSPDQVIWPILGTFFLGIVTALIAYLACRTVVRFDRTNAAAFAAHYGSVSAVTFFAALTFAKTIGSPAEGFMPALVAILEVPAILLALLLAGKHSGGGSLASAAATLFKSKTILLLVGGMIMGLVSGERGFELVSPVFVDLFNGALVFFLLEMGLLTAARLADLKANAVALIGIGVALPLVNGFLGVYVGRLTGLGVSGSGVLGAMAASASYIAAPAVVRSALPKANPSLYLTAALGVTFPFNLAIGIPLYFQLARVM